MSTHNLPPDVQGALNAHQRQFEQLHETIDSDVRFVIRLRLNSYDSEAYCDAVFDRWARSYPSLRSDILNLKRMEKNTPLSTVFWTFLNIYIEMIIFGIRPIEDRDYNWTASEMVGVTIHNDPVRPIFPELIKTGRHYAAQLKQDGITLDGIAWAKARIEEIVLSRRDALLDLIRLACDGPDAEPIKQWLAPLLLGMEPLGPEPYDHDLTWKRMDAAGTAKALDTIWGEYERRLRNKIHDVVDAAYLAAMKEESLKPAAKSKPPVKPKPVEAKIEGRGKGKAKKDRDEKKLIRIQAAEEARIMYKLKNKENITREEARWLWVVGPKQLQRWINAKPPKLILKGSQIDYESALRWIEEHPLPKRRHTT